MNDFIKDAILFISNISRDLNDKISDFKLIQISLNLALALEKLLKGILYNLNPIYILVNPEFNNSLSVLYFNKILPEMNNNKELKNNEDVITFRNAIMRAQYISQTTLDNKALLFKISNNRDIIVHHKLKLLELNSLRNILFQDFFLLLSEYSRELKISQKKMFDGQEFRLSDLSSKYQDDITKKIFIKLENQKKKWDIMKNSPGYIEDKDYETNKIYNTGNKYKIDCPACNNIGLLYTKPILQFNPYENRDVQSGSEIVKFKCQYCKLNITEYDEIDHLKFYEKILNE